MPQDNDRDGRRCAGVTNSVGGEVGRATVLTYRRAVEEIR